MVYAWKSIIAMIITILNACNLKDSHKNTHAHETAFENHGFNIVKM